MMTLRILIADDEKAARFGMSKALAGGDVEIVEAKSGEETLDCVRSRSFHLIFLDLDMPGTDGVGVLTELDGPPAGCEIVVVTADDSLESAITCMRLGACDYITKPFEVEELRAIARRNASRVRLETRVDELQAKLDNKTAFGALVGMSSAMRELFDQMQRAAAAPLDILIRGETGTGKELIARQIHRLSERGEQPFVAVNTAAVSETIAESELFGHVAGSFTGAGGSHKGVFEQANGGTLFLDEIGDMPLSLQTKILRALQERRVLPVGGTEAVPVDIRVLSATHSDLEQAMADGAFRQDLYFRIKGIELHVPPLRQRFEDIVLLANHFLKRYATRSKQKPLTLTREAVNSLVSHSWPGNIRELENAIQAAAGMATGETIGKLNLAPLGARSNATGEDAVFDFTEVEDLPLSEGKARITEWFEKRAIAVALEHHGGNVSAAARQLGLHRQSLQKKMSQLGIAKEGFSRS
ncbi:MAG: sigma-54-dependent Fis family transcriptional regulator [Deltaproteobacteria bacterium]|nr:sigma-54-dependent Fis family transcriptional regulator [Deltaproteobacteria bacterium]